MLRILRFLLTGDWHLHHWEKIAETKINGRIAGGGIGAYGWVLTLRCSKCGEIEYSTYKN